MNAFNIVENLFFQTAITIIFSEWNVTNFFLESNQRYSSEDLYKPRIPLRRTGRQLKNPWSSFSLISCIYCRIVYINFDIYMLENSMLKWTFIHENENIIFLNNFAFHLRTGSRLAKYERVREIDFKYFEKFWVHAEWNLGFFLVFHSPIRMGMKESKIFCLVSSIL